ncbi:MAG: D-alanyl-D-alanine carboxypeptidase [Gammaproteobacteria bacterium]|nr:D-alanyl-D-alanine carboxypeptidase [Gammaproteobacteria bacterium]
MRRFLESVLVLAGLSLAPAAVPAADVPTPPDIGAESYILIDHHSGRVLAAREPDARVEPASITKLMTAYLAFKELEAGDVALSDKTVVSEKAWRMEGSRMFIEVGTEVTVEALLKGMIVQSGNDASVALAEHIAGSETVFVQMMNQEAEALGLANTHYTNATGLPHPEHYTTARDIARLTNALIGRFPQYYEWYSQKKYAYNGIPQYNRNKLLWRDPAVDGVKTGHTEAAGYCLVTSAQRDNMRLVSVVMGTDSEEGRAQASQALLNYGFRFFETRRLYAAGDAVTEARIWKGASEVLALGLSRDLYVTFPRGRYTKLQATMDLDTAIVAPVARHEPHGTLNVSLGDDTLAERPLVAIEAVPEGGLWQRLTDGVLLMFE